MREITAEQIEETVRELCIAANRRLPEDVKAAVNRSAEGESRPLARDILEDLRRNWETAEALSLPVCQDTGMAVVFVRLGQEAHIRGGLLADAVNRGVSRGYREGRLRCSVVGDPLRRVNTNNNTPAIIHLTLVEGDRLSITVAPKGFGSENMTALRMLKPSVGPEAVVDFIVEAVSNAGSNPCPPIVVGVGVGGTSEMAALLAKRALLRPVDQHNEDPFYAGLEAEALSRINALGIGPQGFGGRTTCLGLAIEQMPTHVAGLPVAVNVSCHVTRRASAQL